MQAMSWGATDCTGYVKMLPENDITEPVITSENRRQMNHITGFRKDKTGAPPLATTGFGFHKKKSALVALVNENMTLPVTSHPGWYGQSRSERLSIIHNRL